MPRGGYRPGSGPKKGTKYKLRAGAKAKKPKKAAIPADIMDAAKVAGMTPVDYMLAIMRDVKADADRRDKMAQWAAPYVNPKVGEGKGKKQEREDRAKQAGVGMYAPRTPPLKVVK